MMRQFRELMRTTHREAKSNGKFATRRSGRDLPAFALMLAVLTLTLGFFGFAGIAVAKDGDSVTVDLSEQNDSGLSGTATLTADGDKTIVVVDATGAPEGTTGHMFDSTCDDHASATVFYDFTPLDANGHSETVVDETFENLTTGDYWIHLHKPGVERGGGLLCGNVPVYGAVNAIPATGVGSSINDSQATGALLAGFAAVVLLAASLILRTRQDTFDATNPR